MTHTSASIMKRFGAVDAMKLVLSMLENECYR
jgi:hypothetical protein